MRKSPKFSPEVVKCAVRMMYEAKDQGTSRRPCRLLARLVRRRRRCGAGSGRASVTAACARAWVRWPGLTCARLGFRDVAEDQR